MKKLHGAPQNDCSGSLWLLIPLTALILIVQCTLASGGGVGVGVVYDSRSGTQSKLVQAVWMGFRDGLANGLGPAKTEPQPQPHVVDVSQAAAAAAGGAGADQEVVQWLRSNGTNSIVSLLEESALTSLLSVYSEQQQQPRPRGFGGSGSARVPAPAPDGQLRVILPRECLNQKPLPNIAIKCLRMSESAVALALLHRAQKIGVDKLIPILDEDEKGPSAQMDLYLKYKRVLEAAKAQVKVQLLRPVRGVRRVQEALLGFNGSAEADGVGVLILAKAPSSVDRIVKIVHGLPSAELAPLHMFSPWGVEALNGADDGPGAHPFGIYTVELVGSNEWDNPARRRILTELNAFIGPSPLILTAVLAYDAAFLANAGADAAAAATPARLPLSGPLALNGEGCRSAGVFFGLTPKPAASPSFALLLQPSSFILHDVTTVAGTDDQNYVIVDYQLATSSLLRKEELLDAASLAQSKLGCSKHELEVTTHDPFNQLAYTFAFRPDNLPAYLLIPNQGGYGLSLSCESKEKEKMGSSTTTSILIACTPNGASFDEPVHCFRSNPHQRVKRHSSQRQWSRGRRGGSGSNPHRSHSHSHSHGVQPQKYYPRTYFHGAGAGAAAPRDDNANHLYYQPPPGLFYGAAPSTPAPAHAPYYGYVDSSTPSGYLTTRLDVPINEELTTLAPPPGPSKLPELRQVLKVAKPFVGSCIGSTTGCAMCVLVLGRLPLGAVPAACTGPCFVGTFGSCGSLLGRVFSETTIICTELFKQGHLDIGTFLADAEFGKLIKERSPMTLKGYQFLAAPLVHTMRTSSLVTSIVAKVATCWAGHMKFMMGHQCAEDWLGDWIHSVGAPICAVVGHLVTFVQANFKLRLSLTSFLSGLVALLLLAQRLVRRSRLRRSRSKVNSD